MLGIGDSESARGGADELSAWAEEVGAPPLRAAAAQANGAVLLAEGDVRGALEMLRMAWSTWQSVEIPYEAARVRTAAEVERFLARFAP